MVLSPLSDATTPWILRRSARSDTLSGVPPAPPPTTLVTASLILSTIPMSAHLRGRGRRPSGRRAAPLLMLLLAGRLRLLVSPGLLRLVLLLRLLLQLALADHRLDAGDV